MLEAGWQLKEEGPMLVILFVVVAIAMWANNIGDPAQIFGTAFLVSVVSVSLEVILTGKHK